MLVKGVPFNMDRILYSTAIGIFPRGLVVRIPPSHGGGRGSIPRTGSIFFKEMLKIHDICTNSISSSSLLYQKYRIDMAVKININVGNVFPVV